MQVTDTRISMLIDRMSGLVTWDTTTAPLGHHVVAIRAEGQGETLQRFTLEITNQDPYFTSTAPTVALENIHYRYQANAVDPDGHLIT